MQDRRIIKTTAIAAVGIVAAIIGVRQLSPSGATPTKPTIIEAPAPSAAPNDRSALAPVFNEHTLPALWFRPVAGKEAAGEMHVCFVLRQAQRTDANIYKTTMLIGPDDSAYQSAAREWATRAARVGAMFLAAPGGNRGDVWPYAGSETYALGQLKGVAICADALRRTGIDLSGVRVISNVEVWDKGEQARLMSFSAAMAAQLGFTIGGKAWAANYGSGPAESRGWYHPPMPDGWTVGISSYMDAERDHEQLCQVSIDLVKSMGLRYAIWYRVGSSWAEQQIPAWRRDPACVAVIGWNPKGRVE